MLGLSVHRTYCDTARSGHANRNPGTLTSSPYFVLCACREAAAYREATAAAATLDAPGPRNALDRAALLRFETLVDRLPTERPT